MAVVAESPDDRSVVFRTYCSQWPVDGRRHLRPPILEPGPPAPVMSSAATSPRSRPVTPTRSRARSRRTGTSAEPVGAHGTHRGTGELRSYFAGCFSAGGGIGLQPCAVTDDGVRCALEYNCVRWGSHDLPPQAGIGVYERGPTGCWPRPASTTTWKARSSHAPR